MDGRYSIQTATETDMRYHHHIEINESRINYELREHGSSIVGVPTDCSEEERDTALKVLRSKYNNVDIDIDGDLIVSE
jgi:hypothetical protein